MNKTFENSSNNRIDALESCFEAVRDIRFLVQKNVVDPSGLSMAEADIVYAAYSIRSGREIYHPISGGFCLIEEIMKIATREDYDAPKTSKILQGLNKKGLVEILKFRDLTKCDSTKVVHGNSKCLKLTVAGEGVARQIAERYASFASHFTERIPIENLAIQTAVNRQLSELARHPYSAQNN
jgi:hypothetical protein